MGMIMSVIFYVVVATTLYRINTYSMWEMIMCAIMVAPVRLYAKSNKRWMVMCIWALTLVTSLRYPYVRCVLKLDVAAMVSGEYMLQQIQAAGIVFDTAMIGYLLLIWFITLRMIKREVETFIGSVVKSKRFVLCRNLMYSTVVCYIICLIMSVRVFELKSMWINVIVFALLASLFQVTHTIYCRHLIIEKIKKTEASVEQSE